MNLIYSRIFTALPLLIGLTPIIAVTLAYGLNISADTVPACMPFLEGCTSISGSGRKMPGIMVFRGAMLPLAALMVVFWWLAASSVARKSTLVFGTAGAISLILYVTFLGTQQPFYEFMRRFGIYGYFLGTLLAQWLLTLALPASRLRSFMLFLVAAPLLLGLLNLFLKAVLVDSNDVENQIEWFAALFMQIWFLAVFVLWRQTGFTVVVRTGRPNANW